MILGSRTKKKNFFPFSRNSLPQVHVFLRAQEWTSSLRNWIYPFLFSQELNLPEKTGKFSSWELSLPVFSGKFSSWELNFPDFSSCCEIRLKKHCSCLKYQPPSRTDYKMLPTSQPRNEKKVCREADSNPHSRRQSVWESWRLNQLSYLITSY